MLQLLEQRCKDKFFSHKQHHASLARTDVAAHFKRLATTACFVAVKQTILSRHKQCTNAASVHALISDNLAEAARRLEAERAPRAAHQEQVDRVLALGRHTARIVELETVT